MADVQDWIFRTETGITATIVFHKPDEPCEICDRRKARDG